MRPRAAGGGALAALVLPWPRRARADATAAAERFREAGERVRAGDSPKAHRDLPRAGRLGPRERARSTGTGRRPPRRAARPERRCGPCCAARELDPGDRALPREIERLREAANLDPAEIAPEPLAVLARVSRRFHLGWLALALAAVVGGRARRRALRCPPALAGPHARPGPRLALALLAAAVPVAGALRPAHGGGRPPGRAAARRRLAHRRSRSARCARGGRCRCSSGAPRYLRVEDSSGARGWAHADDVWPLDRRPQP